MLMSSDEPTVIPSNFLGKPLLRDIDEFSDDEAPNRMLGSTKPWNQVVKDDKGRIRFHGAFTGGFSAGHFNTVGSSEGWTPSTFVSSRSSRGTSRKQQVEDFMDQEDLDEASRGFVSCRRESKETLSSNRGGTTDVVPVDTAVTLHRYLRQGQSEEDSIGMRILRTLGHRRGATGLRPQTDSAAVPNPDIIKEKEKQISGILVKGADPPPPVAGWSDHSMEVAAVDIEALKSSERDSDERLFEAVLPSYYVPRFGVAGLGYQRKDLRQLSADLQSEGRESTAIEARPSQGGRKRGIGGRGGDDDDEDLKWSQMYCDSDYDPSQYDFSITVEDDSSRHVHSETRSELEDLGAKDPTFELRDHRVNSKTVGLRLSEIDLFRDPLPGFEVSHSVFNIEERNSMDPPLNVPSWFVGKRKLAHPSAKVASSSTGAALTVSNPQEKIRMRGQLLGEEPANQPPPEKEPMWHGATSGLTAAVLKSLFPSRAVSFVKPGEERPAEELPYSHDTAKRTRFLMYCAAMEGMGRVSDVYNAAADVGEAAAAAERVEFGEKYSDTRSNKHLFKKVMNEAAELLPVPRRSVSYWKPSPQLCKKCGVRDPWERQKFPLEAAAPKDVPKDVPRDVEVPPKPPSAAQSEPAKESEPPLPVSKPPRAVYEEIFGDSDDDI